MASKILVTAHAGCMNTPADSMESVVAGIFAGADVIEVDVRFAWEKVPVLRHNPFSPEEADTLIRLEDVLTKLKAYPRIQLNLDLKETKGVPHLVRLLSQNEMAERVFFTGLEPEAIPGVRAVCDHIPYLVNFKPDFWRKRNGYYLQELVAMVEKLGAIGINLHYKEVTGPLMKNFHEAGLKVYVWTVDQEAKMKSMIRLGVDSLTSKRVDRVIEVIRRMK